MIIANAQISMAAQQTYREEHSVTESLEFWLGGETVVGEFTEVKVPEPLSYKVDLSRAGSLLALHSSQQTLDLSTQLDARSRLNLMILQAMFKQVTGSEMQLSAPDEVLAKAEASGANPPKTLESNTPPPKQVVTRTSGPGLLYQRHERYVEQETMQFQAVGVVRTTDGREIDFSAALAMSREFVQESHLEVRQGDAKIDPLVINFDGQGVGLSQTRFAFDLDSDGTTEQIASLRPGNGYLALDANGDGVINNGSELFGPQTGSGFGELAAYDEDGNQFIDEGDSIYHQLRIWMTNEDGSTQLAALGDKNIGAIFLGHVSSPFQLKALDNESLGEITHSSIYLSEEGGVGVVQEINVTV